MYQINLDVAHGIDDLRALLKQWNDGAKFSTPVVIIKISEAFAMYHQVDRSDLVVHRNEWAGRHPIIINDLDTHNNVVLVLNTNGVILHYYLIDDQGQLQMNDNFRKVAHKNGQEEYLDYFYCIAKNIESCVNTGKP